MTSPLDRLKQIAAQKKTVAAARAAGGDPTGTRARLLEVHDPQPTKPPGETYKPKYRPSEPEDSDLDYEGRGECVSVEVDDVKACSAKASLCVIEGEEHWIPLSQMYAPGKRLDARGQSGTIWVPEWLAEDKGIGW